MKVEFGDIDVGLLLEECKRLQKENSDFRTALETYREFQIGIPHHNGATIFVADDVLRKHETKPETK